MKEEETDVRWFLWIGIALILVSALYSLDSSQGFKNGLYGTGVRGLPSQKVEGEKALARANDSRQKALIFGAFGLVLVTSAIVRRLTRKQQNEESEL